MEYAIAIDIGGTTVKYALVSREGEIVFESMKASKFEDSGRGVSKFLGSIVQELLTFASTSNLEVIGIGVGVPSVVDDGVVLHATNLHALNNQNIKTLLSAYSKLPVLVDNDANLMGLGEIKYGAHKDVTDAVFLTIGTGIGGGLFLNGKMYGGYRNRGTELGFILIKNSGSESCGEESSFEACASTTALIIDYSKRKKIDSEHVDGKYIIEKYLQREEEAIATMNTHFGYMAIGIASLINVFAPQKVIIGGGISEAGDFYIEKIREKTSKIVMPETSSFTTIESASLGNKAGFLGAAALVFENTNKDEPS